MAAKKILILTASIGSGHIKAAEAVAQELKRQQPETEIVTVDFMARSTSFWHWLTKKIYLEMLNFVPNLYDVFYKLSSSETGGSCGKNMFAYFMLPVFERLQHELQPDGIICTHPFPAGTVSLWKEKHQSNLPLSVVMTDYSLHQMWLCSGVENYFMATEAISRRASSLFGDACSCASVKGVRISPGAMALTRTPKPASSKAKAFVNITTAPLLAQ